MISVDFEEMFIRYHKDWRYKELENLMKSELICLYLDMMDAIEKAAKEKEKL